MIGLLLNAFFGTTDIISLDGVNSNPGGFMDHNWKQLYIQFAYICAVTAYSFVVTAAIAKGIDMIPGLHLRGTPESEKLGMDEIEVRLLKSITNRLVPDHWFSDWRVCHRLH